jgi:hypothetical protein
VRIQSIGTVLAVALLALTMGGCGSEIQDDGPAYQRAFAKTVNHYSDVFQNKTDGKNELQEKDLEDKAVHDRNRALCKIFHDDLEVEDWVGEVDEIEKEVLGEKVTLHVTVGEGDADPSLQGRVKKDSRVYKQIYKLSEGDRVKLSGRFKKDDDACVYDQNVTTVFRMTSPDFSFTFTDVQAG